MALDEKEKYQEQVHKITDTIICAINDMGLDEGDDNRAAVLEALTRTMAVTLEATFDISDPNFRAELGFHTEKALIANLNGILKAKNGEQA